MSREGVAPDITFIASAQHWLADSILLHKWRNGEYRLIQKMTDLLTCRLAPGTIGKVEVGKIVQSKLLVRSDHPFCHRLLQPSPSPGYCAAMSTERTAHAKTS